MAIMAAGVGFGNPRARVVESGGVEKIAMQMRDSDCNSRNLNGHCDSIGDKHG